MRYGVKHQPYSPVLCFWFWHDLLYPPFGRPLNDTKLMAVSQHSRLTKSRKASPPSRGFGTEASGRDRGMTIQPFPLLYYSTIPLLYYSTTLLFHYTTND